MITAVTGEPRAKAAASERTVGDAFADCLARYAWVVLVLLLAGFAWFVWSHWRGRVRASQAAV